MQKWFALGLSVTVKAHLLECHASYQMEYFHGVGDFIEDFMSSCINLRSAVSNEWDAILILRKNATQ